MIFKTVAIICIGIVFLEIAVVVGIVLICVLDKDDEGMYDPKENVMCAQTGKLVFMTIRITSAGIVRVTRERKVISKWQI